MSLQLPAASQHQPTPKAQGLNSLGKHQLTQIEELQALYCWETANKRPGDKKICVFKVQKGSVSDSLSDPYFPFYAYLRVPPPLPEVGT